MGLSDPIEMVRSHPADAELTQLKKDIQKFLFLIHGGKDVVNGRAYFYRGTKIKSG